MLLRYRTSKPATLAVTLADAKAHLRVETSDEDTLITALIGAAMDQIAWCGRSLVETQWSLDLDAFPGAAETILLPRPPLKQVDAVRYRDAAGDEQTLSDAAYEVVAPAEDCAFIRLALDADWPDTDGERACVTVDFTSKADEDKAVRAALLLIIGGLYEQRGSEADRMIYENPAVDRLLSPKRVYSCRLASSTGA